MSKRENDTQLSKVEEKALIKSLAEEDKRKRANQNNLVHLSHMQKISRPNIQVSEEVDSALTEYLNLCSADNVMPTASGMAMALGVSRTQLLEWVNGGGKYPNRDVVARYYSMLEVYDEISMKEGNVPPLIAIFNAKNNHGYKDEVTYKTSDEELSDEEIERRYREKHEIVSDQ